MDPYSLGFLPGLSKLFSADNVAITTLLTMVLFEAMLIWYLLNGLFAVKDALHKIAITLALINERIGRHQDNDD